MPQGGNPDQPSLRQIISVALGRPRVREALFAYATGGPGGMFEAYEAICYELSDCGVLNNDDAYIGSKQWLVQQGWITEEEDDRFLKTVLHYRGHSEQVPPFESLSPYDTQILLRRVLGNLISFFAVPRG